MRRVLLLAVCGLFVTACSGDADPVETTVDPAVAWQVVADEYAVGADRALDGTAFEDLPADRLADVIVDLCGRIAESSDPDGTIGELVGGIDPAADPEDVGLMLEVVAIGMSEVCPEEVLAAQAGATGIGDPEDAYAAAVIPAVSEAAGEDAPSVPTLLAAGDAVCASLDDGANTERSALAVIEVLFAVRADSLAEADGLVPDWAGDVVGTVLGAAATIVCPEHAGTVADFVSGTGA